MAGGVPGLSFTSTKLQATQSAALSAAVTSNPIISLVVGAGESSPAGSGTSSGGASATAQPHIGGDTFPNPFQASSLFGGFRPQPVNDISRLSGAAIPAAPAAGAGGGLFDDPIMLAVIAGGVALLFFMGKK